MQAAKTRVSAERNAGTRTRSVTTMRKMRPLHKKVELVSPADWVWGKKKDGVVSYQYNLGK